MGALNFTEQIYFEKNGEQALKKLQQLFQSGIIPCIIIADPNMPKMSGTELLRILKNMNISAKFR
ncbi:MAG: hypothetical protein C4329_05845 [Chitinophagaceae bacterium]